MKMKSKTEQLDLRLYPVGTRFRMRNGMCAVLKRVHSDLPDEPQSRRYVMLVEGDGCPEVWRPRSGRFHDKEPDNRDLVEVLPPSNIRLSLLTKDVHWLLLRNQTAAPFRGVSHCPKPAFGTAPTSEPVRKYTVGGFLYTETGHAYADGHVGPIDAIKVLSAAEAAAFPLSQGDTPVTPPANKPPQIHPLPGADKLPIGTLVRRRDGKVTEIVPASTRATNLADYPVYAQYPGEGTRDTYTVDGAYMKAGEHSKDLITVIPEPTGPIDKALAIQGLRRICAALPAPALAKANGLLDFLAL